MHCTNASAVNAATTDNYECSHFPQQMAPQHCIVGNVQAIIYSHGVPLQQFPLNGIYIKNLIMHLCWRAHVVAKTDYAVFSAMNECTL